MTIVYVKLGSQRIEECESVVALLLKSMTLFDSRLYSCDDHDILSGENKKYDGRCVNSFGLHHHSSKKGHISANIHRGRSILSGLHIEIV
jgi:hypothetical protein